MIGGRKLAAPLARRSGGFQMAMGVVMVLVAFAMWQNYDTKFQSNVTADLPCFLRNPAEGIEKSGSAQNALARIHREGTDGIGLKAQKSNPNRGGRREQERAPKGEKADRTGYRSCDRANRSSRRRRRNGAARRHRHGARIHRHQDWFNTPVTSR